jgi:hypothetical protein
MRNRSLTVARYALVLALASVMGCGEDPNPDDNAQSVVVLANFTAHPGIRSQLQPLVDEWAREDIGAVFLDVAGVADPAAKDGATRLREKLETEYGRKRFEYLFIIDDIHEGLFHVPLPFFKNDEWHNDLYYGFLSSDFDLNRNGVNAENEQDYALQAEKPVAVGRLLFLGGDLESQLSRYVAADLQFRKKKAVHRFTYLLYHDEASIEGAIDGWHREFNEALKAFIETNGGTVDKNVNVASAEQANRAIVDSDFVFYFGHGSNTWQQVGYTGPADADGFGLTTNDILRFREIRQPAIHWFGGCYSGALLSRNALVANSIVGAAPLTYADVSSVPAVGVIANTGAGVFFCLGQRDSLKDMLAEGRVGPGLAATQERWLQTRTGQNDRYYVALTFQLYGDPTLPFAIGP